MSDISNLLGERQQTHGSYSQVSKVCQAIKSAMRNSGGWLYLSDEQKESLEMTAMKIARIVCGNPNHADHWEDIEGYARLVSNELERERVADMLEQSIKDAIGPTDLDEENHDEQSASTDNQPN